jgi:hypothetical protein
VTFGVFHILDAAITAQKLSESRLALYVGFAAHVFFAEHQKVEGEGSGPGIIRTTVQGFKVSDTIGVEPDSFSVKNGRAFYPRRVLHNQRVGCGPIRAIHCVETHPPIPMICSR